MKKYIKISLMAAFLTAVFLLATINADATTKTVPHLKLLDYYKSGTTYNAKLTWHSVKGHTYTVYRKKSGSYNAITNVKATGSMASYIDKNIGIDKGYTYTVKQISPKPKGNYDKAGLTLINHVGFNVDFQNIKSVISWSKVSKAKHYYIYRIREGEKRRRIGVSSGTKFTDTFAKDKSALKNILHLNTFVDPSIRDFAYNIRATYATKVNKVKKESKGLYLPDETSAKFKLEPPTIISLNSSTLKWGKVPKTKYYKILQRSSSSESWHFVKKVTPTKAITQSTTIPNVDKKKYYAVQAVGMINGREVTSKIEGGFTKRNASHSNKNILFIGNSITYGSPYKSAGTRHIFSYPNRIAQLTGVNFYNPSIPGATYHYNNNKNVKTPRFRLVTDVVKRLYDGQIPANSSVLDTAKNSKGQKNTRIKDYDVVFLAAGTNDYADGVKLGSSSSTDQSTFNGAFNKIMDYIKQSSIERVSKGKSKIKVVFVDLFYSERIDVEGPGLVARENRDTTPNKANLTLKSYQSALNNQFTKWSKNKYLSLYKYKTRNANIVNSSNILYMTPDRLHFTRYSYALYGNDMARFLLNNVL